GGWGGTPVGEVLPVQLENGTTNAKYFSWINARPTRAGATFPVTQVAADEKTSSAKWNDMPPVSAVNSVRFAKPGATVLLTGNDERRGRAGRADQDDGRSARLRLRRGQRQPRRRARDVAVGQDDGAAGRVDGDEGRRLPRDVHAGRSGHLRHQGQRRSRSEGA